MIRTLPVFVSVVIAAALWAIPAEVRAEPGKRVIGYFAEWSGGDASNLPGEMLTHVNYAFGLIKDGQIASDSGDAFQEHCAQLLALKRKYPHIRTLISVGGWGGSSPFSDMAFTDASRKKFAASCAAFVSKYGFDGVDIDWEYPGGGGMDPTKGRPEDKQTFTLLLAELRSQLDAQGKNDQKQYLLTIASAGLPRDLNATDLGKIHPYLDWINLMSYDLAGIWSKVTGFNAPLFSSGHPSDQKENVDASVQSYLAAGVPKDKLVVGVPFYGKAWGGVKDIDHGLQQPPDGKPPRPPGGGEWTYRYLADKYIDKVAPRFWHEQAKVPWSYDAKTGIFVTYDDPQSIQLKAQYVRDHDLGGVMIWELNQDDPQLSMLKAVNSGLTRAAP